MKNNFIKIGIPIAFGAILFLPSTNVSAYAVKEVKDPGEILIEEPVSDLEEAKDLNHREDIEKAIREELVHKEYIKENKSLYTEKSFKNYSDAVVLAKSAIENPNSSQEDLLSGLDLLKNTREGLEELSKDKEKKKAAEIKELKKAVEECKYTKKAAQIVMTHAKKISSKNKDYLEKLIEDADALLLEAEQFLNYHMGIRG